MIEDLHDLIENIMRLSNLSGGNFYINADKTTSMTLWNILNMLFRQKHICTNLWNQWCDVNDA